MATLDDICLARRPRPAPSAHRIARPSWFQDQKQENNAARDAHLRAAEEGEIRRASREKAQQIRTAERAAEKQQKKTAEHTKSGHDSKLANNKVARLTRSLEDKMGGTKSTATKMIARTAASHEQNLKKRDRKNVATRSKIRNEAKQKESA